MPGDLSTVKALTFDVFGTVVDWRGSLIAEGQRLGARLGRDLDWAAFVDAWRAGYAPAMDRVRRGELPWLTIDQLHRRILDQLLDHFGITELSEAEIVELNRAWHRLQPWPDSVAGLTRLRARFIVATLSNGNVGLLTRMAKQANLPWDCILSAELARRYKPDHQVYRLAADLLNLAPWEVLMVAAHADDLHAAHAVGLRTAFVRRPLEFGPDRAPDQPPLEIVDLVAEDTLDLAQQLGA